MGDGLEAALTALEDDLDMAVKTLATALKEAKKAKAAATSGQLRALRQALASAARLADEGASAAAASCDWTFDDQAHFASGAFAKEVLALASDEGVQAFESDDRILSYPTIVQVSVADTTVVIDKKKDRRVRPSVLVATLGELQSLPPKFKPQPFLDALAVAYDLVRGRASARPGATVKLVDVYGALTVLPGSGRDYTKQEFARDLYLLDQSGVTAARDGRVMRLPASALTRGTGVLTTVTRSGQEKVYAGITFTGSDG